MKTSSTKKRFVLSLVAVIACVAMLVGTTMAWFTDSVTSGKNKIVAGNLDVDLLMYKESETTEPGYVSIANEEGAIFGKEDSLVAQNNSADTLWEPGKTQIVFLAVKNVGNLAFKYNIKINTSDIEEHPSMVQNGYSALEYAILDKVTQSGYEALDPKPTKWSDITSITSAQTGDITLGTKTAAENGSIKEKDGIDYFALAVHMKEDAGNEFQNAGIMIDVTVVATQESYEKDSFDEKYDLLAELPIVAEAEVKSGEDTEIISKDDVGKILAKATVPAEAQQQLPEDTKKIMMTIEDTEKPSQVELEDGEEALNLDVKFFAVSSNGTKTQITDFGAQTVTVDLSAQIPEGYTLTKVFHTHGGVVRQMTKSESLTVTDGEYDFNSETKMLTIGSKKFSPFTFVVKGKDYGFHKSYQEGNHWVHEITTPEHFRNIMDSTTHEDKKAQFDYPGAGNKDTVYLIKNDINFNGSIYSADLIEEVKAKPFTGILKGDGMVTLSNVHLEDVMNSGMSDHTAIWGLFDGVVNATFESLTLSDFIINSNDGKDCGFLAAGQCDQNLKSKNPDYDNSAYLKAKDVIVLDNCSINASGNAGAFFGICRSLDYIELENCINSADVNITGNNAGGFCGDASYDEGQTPGWGNFPNHNIVVNNCVNNGHITAGDKGYVSALIGYNLHVGTISNFTNNGIIEVQGNGGTDIGVATGRSTSSPLVTYDNVVQNGCIMYSGTLPLQKHENTIAKMQVYYSNQEGNLVSGFDGNSAVKQDYKDRTFVLSTAVKLSLSFDEDGNLVVGENSLTNVNRISVALFLGRHSGNSNTGIVLNSSSTGSYQVYYNEIDSTSGTTQELNTAGLKKVNQLGYFAPNGITPVFGNDWGRIVRYCEQFRLESSLYGTTGYTENDLGYHINSKGGYVLIRDVSSNGFTVLTPLHQDPHFVIKAYDSYGNVIGFGDIYSGRIVGEHIPEDIHVTAGIDKYVYIE